MNPVVLDLPYFSQFWSSKLAIPNVVKMLPKIEFFASCKNWGGSPKNQDVR